MPSQDIEGSFPGLATGGYRLTSPVSADYNCAAWAAGEMHRWWDSSAEGGYYWPPGVPTVMSLANLIAAFASLGFQRCPDGHAEPGFEKLALYADVHGWPTHVARQIPSGVWTSKLGAAEDIEHATLEGLEGELYGKVVQYLRRRVSQ